MAAGLQKPERRRRRRGTGDEMARSFGQEMAWLSGQETSTTIRHRTWASARSFMTMLCALLLVLASIPVAGAAWVPFENCLSTTIKDSTSPQQLQFRPYFVDAKFDTTDPRHNLTITVYGNVTGQRGDGEYPSPQLWNSTDPAFNIVDAPLNYTTLFTNIDVLSYKVWSPSSMRFCNYTAGGACPLGPLFNVSKYDWRRMHAFTVSTDMSSSYSFASLATSLKVQSGDSGGALLACIEAGIAPDLGKSLSNALRLVPLGILILVGIATIVAARFSPWSSADVFCWTSNYGRDDDILRLITPGFGDCLQYIQFVVLAGSLSLAYPGFYQPVVSQASWSVLMFNESFVSHGPGARSLLDGVYSVNGSYGLSHLGQLAGMTENSDVWAGMAVWLSVMVLAVIIICQLWFAGGTLVRMISNNPEEDLRSNNIPFTAGNIVRIIFNYFLLPIIALSMFQLVLASSSPAFVVALAVISIFLVIAVAAWIFRLVFTTKPRVHLFDHLPLLLACGPLYNTYSDEAAPYAFIPFLVTFIRGIAIGAIQPSGTIQLVILAICEVVLILTLHAFRPFQSLTSMNAYHTFFAVVRLITTLMMVAFVPSLSVSESIKGWIGYAILLLHAIVLLFGFLLNALQTIIEVLARLAKGSETRGGFTTVFGMRQLSKRGKRTGPRDSMISHGTMFTDAKSHRASRTLSGNSTVMLNAKSPDARGSAVFESLSQVDVGSTVSGTSPGPSTPGGQQSPFSFLPATNVAETRRMSKPMEPSDPYYRPPRQRRATNELLADEEMAVNARSRTSSHPPPAVYSDLREAPSVLGTERGSVGAAYFRALHDSSEAEDRMRADTDYTTRESDFYYGVRGPALSKQPTRRLKTGPADPMSPVASATGWFRSFLGAKKKDKKKGFEVVRSTPLHLLKEENDEASVTRSGAEDERSYTDKVSKGNIYDADAAMMKTVASATGEVHQHGSRRDSEDTVIPSSEAELLTLRHMASSSCPPQQYNPQSVSTSRAPTLTSLKQTSTASLPHRNPKRDSRSQSSSAQLSRVSSFRGPGNTDPDARVPFASLDGAVDRKRGAARESMVSVLSGSSSIYGSECGDVVEAADEGARREVVYSDPFFSSRYDRATERQDATVAGAARRGRDGAGSRSGSGSGLGEFASGGEIERPMSTGRVAQRVVRRDVYGGRLLDGSEAEVVREDGG